MNDKRRRERYAASFEVVLTVPGQEPMTLMSGNISEGGIFLLSGGNPMPEVGTEVHVALSELIADDIPVVMRARVAHKRNDGIGIEFQGLVIK